MDNLKLRELKYKLLTNGVAYKHVNRLLKEMQDHHVDLIENGISQGQDLRESYSAADSQLGKYDLIAKEMIAKKELHSWGSRYPKLVFLILPLLSYILLYPILFFLFVNLVEFVIPVSNEEFREPVGLIEKFFSLNDFVILKTLMQGIKISLMYIVGTVFAMVSIMYALKNHLSLILAGIGVFLVCVLSSATAISFVMPDISAGPDSGSIGVSLGFGLFEFRGWLDPKLRLLFSLALVSTTAWIYQKKLRGGELDA